MICKALCLCYSQFRTNSGKIRPLLCTFRRLLCSGQPNKLAQAEIPVHMLNWVDRSVKYSSVQFDQAEDEEIAVSDTAHLRAEDLDLGVEGLGWGIGRTSAEIHGSLYGEQSEMSVIAGTDCDILKVPLKDFIGVLSSNLLIEYRSLFKTVLLRHLNIYRKTPEQRYIMNFWNQISSILKKQSEIMNMVV